MDKAYYESRRISTVHSWKVGQRGRNDRQIGRLINDVHFKVWGSLEPVNIGGGDMYGARQVCDATLGTVDILQE